MLKLIDQLSWNFGCFSKSRICSIKIVNSAINMAASKFNKTQLQHLLSTSSLIPMYSIGTIEIKCLYMSDFHSPFIGISVETLVTQKPHPCRHHDWKSWPECLKSGSDRRRYLPTLRSAESTGRMRVMERRKYYVRTLYPSEYTSLGK